MEPSELLRTVVAVLTHLGIPYRVVGSMASTLYGEPRSTNDIDLVVQMNPDQVDAFCASFAEPEYYYSVEAVRQAVEQHFQFNILHPASGLKVDVILATDSPFDQTRFLRGQLLLTDATHEAWIASPEDVILKKLVYFQEGGSEKHLRDIVGILKVQGNLIDQAYLTKWVVHLGVAAEWQLVMSRMQPTRSVS